MPANPTSSILAFLVAFAAFSVAACSIESTPGGTPGGADTSLAGDAMSGGTDVGLSDTGGAADAPAAGGDHGAAEKDTGAAVDAPSSEDDVGGLSDEGGGPTDGAGGATCPSSASPRPTGACEGDLRCELGEECCCGDGHPSLVCRRSPCAHSSQCPGGYCVKGRCYPHKGICSHIPA